MKSEFADNILFPVIRAGLDLEEISLELSDTDIARLLQLGKNQSLIPIIYRGLKHNRSSRKYYEFFLDDYNNSIFTMIQQDHSLKQVCALLDSAAIPYIPLKGAVLRDLYPEIWLRTSNDIDILVREEDLENAISCIEKGTDFVSKGRQYHDVSLLNSYVHLELHFSLKENMENMDKVLAEAWSYAHPAEEGSNLYEFTDEFQLLYLIAHMAYHMTHSGLGIRPFIDLWLFQKHTAYDKDIFAEMLEKCSMKGFYEQCVKLSRAWLENVPADPDTELLSRYCLNGGVFDFGPMTGAVKLRNSSKFDYISRRLITTREILQEEYPELKEKPGRLPYYQIKRWLRLLDKDKRKKIKNEINRIQVKNQESKEDIKALIRRMGLK